jgi:ribonuclease T2
MAAVLALMTPGGVLAQGTGCALPASLPRPHSERATPEQPMRRVPTTGYTLSLIWGPEACRAARGRPARAGDLQCRSRRDAARFTLHGLWPDGTGFNRWPQYCRPATLLTDTQLRRGLCATPSVQLLQHEWAKHGTCMTDDPVAYFTDETRLFERIRYPDMRALARRRSLTAAQFQQAFARANPGMTADMMRLNLNKRGWLEEVWLCLGRDRRSRACPAEQGGASSDAPVRIQAP